MFLGLPKNTIKQYYGVARVEQQSFFGQWHLMGKKIQGNSLRDF
jgi:hypothetical protein